MPRYFVDSTAKRLVLILGIISFAILLFIFVFILREAIPGIQDVGLFEILFGTKWAPSYGHFGLLPLIVGSILSTLLALVIAVPLSLGCAIFLAEVAPPRLRAFARPAVELLVGIPSVVYGLVGLLVLCPVIANIGSGSGRSLLAAGIVLAVMILPTVASISEDCIRAVPKEYKEGALALGATHWQTIWHVLLPAARSGIIAAVILGTGRAIGETMAMIMVIGNSAIFPTSLFDPAYTLTGAIASEIMEASPLPRSVLFAAGLFLFILVTLINIIALTVHRRMSQ
jgi:phosphate transport system permease protein